MCESCSASLRFSRPALDADAKVTQTTVSDPLGRARQVSFHASGYPASDTQAAGSALAQTWSYERQADGLLSASVDPLGRRTEYTYDSQGNKTRVTYLAGSASALSEAMSWTSDFNQLVSYTDPLNHQSTYTYDALGRLTALKDPLNHVTQFDYNDAGQVVRITDALNQSTQFGYDAYDL